MCFYEKKLIAVACLICLSIPVVANAASTGSSKKIDSLHGIMADLNVSGGSANAVTGWEGHESNCSHGLYAYIEAVDQNGDRLESGTEHYNWNAGKDESYAYTSTYNGRAYYFNSRHTTCSSSSGIYLQLSRY